MRFYAVLAIAALACVGGCRTKHEITPLMKSFGVEGDHVVVVPSPQVSVVQVNGAPAADASGKILLSPGDKLTLEDGRGLTCNYHIRAVQHIARLDQETLEELPDPKDGFRGHRMPVKIVKDVAARNR